MLAPGIIFCANVHHATITVDVHDLNLHPLVQNLALQGSVCFLTIRLTGL